MYSISQNLNQLARSSSLTSIQRQWQNSLKIVHRSPTEFVSGMSVDHIHKSVEYQKQIQAKVQHRLNLNQQISLTQIFEAGLQSITNPLYRLEEISTQASSDLLSATQREILQQEANEIIAHIHNIIDTTEFNGRKILQEGYSNLQQDTNQDITYISALTDSELLHPQVERSRYDIVFLFDASASLASRNHLFDKVIEMVEFYVDEGIDLSVGLAISYIDNHNRPSQVAGPHDTEIHSLVDINNTLDEDTKDERIKSLRTFLDDHEPTIGRIDFGRSISDLDQTLEWREESAHSIIAVTTAGGEDEKGTIESAVQSFLEQNSDRNFSALATRQGATTESTFFKDLIETNQTGSYHNYSDGLAYSDIIDASVSEKKILNFNVLSAIKAQNSMHVIDHAIDHLSDIRTQVSALQQGRQQALENVWQQEVTYTQAQERYLKNEEMKNLASLSQQKISLKKSVLYQKDAFSLFGQNLLQIVNSIV